LICIIAITGIGSANLINVQVDFDARMDIKDLKKKLDECLAAKRAIYAVVAIIGSTEHGACDPLKDIVALRKEVSQKKQRMMLTSSLHSPTALQYQSKGLSFVLHADGAWGTYYHATLNPNPNLRAPRESDQYFVPSMPLKPSTRDSLLHLRDCETITVDPHKSGYIQYPAGGLLYRDGRMRYLVTWTSPVVFRNDEESMGVYGVEGRFVYSSSSQFARGLTS
jgi:glutamate/tyrosine decarboxylase-like PLP-dependent enzyme